MRAILIALAAFGILWVLVVPRPGEHGPSEAERRAANEYGLRAAQKELDLHDRTVAEQVEIEALLALAFYEVDSWAEAERAGRNVVAQRRRDILDQIASHQARLR